MDGVPDRRTAAGRLYFEKVDALTQMAGPSPTQRQLMLIERAARIHMRLGALDDLFDAGKSTPRDDQTSATLTNSMARCLREIAPPAKGDGGGPSCTMTVNGVTSFIVTNDPDDPRVAAGTALYFSEEEMKY